MLIDSVFRTGKSYYPQVFLEECKYVVKEKKIPKYIPKDVESFFDEENSDEQNSDKENSDEENHSEEQISFFERTILRMSFLREEFSECILLGSNL